jgi:hypothetical protein
VLSEAERVQLKKSFFESVSIESESSVQNWQWQNNGKKGSRQCKEDFNV